MEEEKGVFTGPIRRQDEILCMSLPSNLIILFSSFASRFRHERCQVRRMPFDVRRGTLFHLTGTFEMGDPFYTCTL